MPRKGAGENIPRTRRRGKFIWTIQLYFPKWRLGAPSVAHPDEVPLISVNRVMDVDLLPIPALYRPFAFPGGAGNGLSKEEHAEQHK